MTGRVQGVWFRATTQSKAESLRLDGWARNLPDGRVEVVVAGLDAAVAELCGWLWTGPRNAHVQAVEVVDYGEPVTPGFTTR